MTALWVYLAGVVGFALGGCLTAVLTMSQKVEDRDHDEEY